MIADRLEDADSFIARGQPAIIGIDGHSGAGKSTLAGELAHFLSAMGDPPAVVGLDRIYPGWDGLEAGVSILSDDVLPALHRGQQASYPRWDWLHHRTASRPGTVQPSWCVIAEGVGSCARRCTPFLALQIWIQTPEGIRYERAMARDGETYRPQWVRWAAQEERHFRTEQTAQRSDLRLRPA